MSVFALTVAPLVAVDDAPLAVPVGHYASIESAMRAGERHAADRSLLLTPWLPGRTDRHHALSPVFEYTITTHR